MDKAQLNNRTKAFAVRVFRVVDKFPKTKSSDVVAYQLLRSASSVAANYSAVNRAKSKADFINKMGIVLEEADECNFWLTFLNEIEILKNDSEVESLTDEANQLSAIFAAALKTLKSKRS